MDPQAEGTIPAWAGEPFSVIPNHIRIGDHPRVGGGTTSSGERGVFEDGPSPRGRGNRQTATACPTRHGTIPAWAGEPFINRSA